MPKEASLPPAFAALAGKVLHVQQVTDTEYSCTCPKCGDAGHDSRAGLPDRFRLFDDEHPTGWCRRCGHLWFPDGTKTAMSREQFEAWRRERIEQEQARKRSAERALEHLQSEELWLRYHDALDTFYRNAWHARGLSDAWIDYWELGCKRDWSFRQGDGHSHRTGSLTIPLLDHDRSCINVKHRLLDPPPDRPGMRYLYELKDQAQADPLFICNLEIPLEGHVIAVEGEIKAQVAFATLDDPKCVMVGLPGTNPKPESLRRFDKAERITLVMDPDADAKAEKLAGQLGKDRCRILITPVKIDDGIIAGALTKREVRAMLRTAVPAAEAR